MAARLKSWLFVVALLVMLLGPFAVGITNRALDDRMDAILYVQPSPSISGDPDVECIPLVDENIFEALNGFSAGNESDTTVSFRLAQLFAADQAARQLPWIDPYIINEEDTARRVEVLEYVQDSEIQSPRDLVYAAFIFQHGDCPEHYLLANRLAQTAMDEGYENARWIYAATLDRYLMSLGEMQKFGTQKIWVDGEYELYPVDPATTDEERALYNVPPLNETTQEAKIETGQTRRRWLESWWLTMIGVAFAGLSAAIGLLDLKKNAVYGWIVLGIAVMIYIASAAGHYAQISALQQGMIDMQGRFWNMLNISVIGLWVILALVETWRIIRKRGFYGQ